MNRLLAILTTLLVLLGAVPFIRPRTHAEEALLWLDLLLPHISPAARTASRGVEQFLARLS